jgi:4-hydroxybenzoate polyprenyltransferase
MSGQLTQPFSLTALLRLTRFWNLVIIGFSQYVAAGALIDPKSVFGYRLFFLSASTILIAAAGYVINDYYDIKIDLINKPGRVVIGKSITRRYALFFHTLLSLAGVGIGILLSWKIGLVNFISGFLLWWYSNSLKRQPFIGNFTVALLTGLSIELVNVFFEVNNHLVTIYAIFAFFITLVREIIKDMEDLKGDHTFGCRTLPIIWGLRKTKVLLYGLLLVFCATVVALNYLLVGLPMRYFGVFLFLPMGWLLVKLIRADTIRDFHWLSLFCKAIMLMGIMSMAFV